MLRNFAAWSQRDAHHVDGRCAGVIILTDEFRTQAKVLQLKCAMRLAAHDSLHNRVRADQNSRQQRRSE
jgi:hypothetical protein